MPLSPSTKKTRVTVSHVLNQAAVQFICSLLMGRVSVSSWVTYQQKNLRVSPADCSDQDLKGGQILDAGPSCLTLRKVTDLREIKCRAVQAPWQHWTQLFLFFWFYSSSMFAFQSVTNPRCVYNPEPSIHILLEWQFILFFLHVFFLFISLFIFSFIFIISGEHLKAPSRETEMHCSYWSIEYKCLPKLEINSGRNGVCCH